MNIIGYFLIILNFLRFRDFSNADVNLTSNQEFKMDTIDQQGLNNIPFTENVDYKETRHFADHTVVLGPKIAYRNHIYDQITFDASSGQIRPDTKMNKNYRNRNRTSLNNTNALTPAVDLKNVTKIFIKDIANETANTSKIDENFSEQTSSFDEKNNFLIEKTEFYDSKNINDTSNALVDCICKDTELCRDEKIICSNHNCCYKDTSGSKNSIKNVMKDNNKYIHDYRHDKINTETNVKQTIGIENLINTIRIRRDIKVNMQKDQINMPFVSNELKMNKNKRSAEASNSNHYKGGACSDVALEINKVVWDVIDEYKNNLIKALGNDNTYQSILKYKWKYSIFPVEIHNSCKVLDRESCYEKNVFEVNIDGKNYKIEKLYYYLRKPDDLTRINVKNLLIDCFLKYGSCCKKALIIYNNGKILVIGGEIVDVLAINDVEKQDNEKSFEQWKKRLCEKKQTPIRCCIQYAKLITAQQYFSEVFIDEEIYLQLKKCKNNSNINYDMINVIKPNYIHHGYDI